MRSQRTRPFWLRRDSARVPEPAPTVETEKSTARFGSGARRNTECAHVPPLAAIALVGDGFVHASLKFGFHPRSASSAVSCVSFAATP